jgi:hypothetical protein
MGFWKRRHYLSAGLLLAAWLLAPAFAWAAGASCEIPVEFIDSRPGPEGTPTEISIGLYIIEAYEIDDAQRFLVADAMVWLQWQDPRLEEYAGCRVAYEDLWHPDLRLVNRRSISTTDPELFVIGQGGTVTYEQRGYGEFSAPLDLRDFPLDRQVLPFRIVSGYTPEEVVLRVAEEVTGRQDTLSLVGWNAGEVSWTTGTYHFAPQQQDLAALTFRLPVTRKVGYFFWKMIIPLSIVVFMSWAVFWIDPEVAPARIGLSATALLTVFAYQFVLSNLLPAVSYLTRLDRYFVGASMLVFLALVQAVSTVAVHRGGRPELALRLSRRARVIFPCLYIAVVAIAFLV